MKAIHIFLLLVVAVLALGCVDRTGPDSTAPRSSTPAPVSSQTPSSSNTITDGDDFGLDEDITEIDSLLNESDLDVSLSEINADAFI